MGHLEKRLNLTKEVVNFLGFTDGEMENVDGMCRGRKLSSNPRPYCQLLEDLMTHNGWCPEADRHMVTSHIGEQDTLNIPRAKKRRI